jgi:phytepsin
MRALFDTGSTNTWVLNAKTDIGREKEFSYDETKSSTYKPTDKAAEIHFGSGSLSGTFVTDDLRVGSCDGKSSG